MEYIYNLEKIYQNLYINNIIKAKPYNDNELDILINNYDKNKFSLPILNKENLLYTIKKNRKIIDFFNLIYNDISADFLIDNGYNLHEFNEYSNYFDNIGDMIKCLLLEKRHLSKPFFDPNEIIIKIETYKYDKNISHPTESKNNETNISIIEKSLKIVSSVLKGTKISLSENILTKEDFINFKWTYNDFAKLNFNKKVFENYNISTNNEIFDFYSKTKQFNDCTYSSWFDDIWNNHYITNQIKNI